MKFTNSLFGFLGSTPQTYKLDRLLFLPWIIGFDIAIVFVLANCITSPVQADFLVVPPPNATVLMSEEGPPNSNVDQVVLLQKPSFSGNFYGQSRTSFYVSENGNINFANNDSYFTDRLDSPATQNQFPGGLIAPLWDDVFLITGTRNAVLDHSIPGDFLAVTWKNVSLFLDTPGGAFAGESQRSMQVVWFERSMNYRGFNFLKDDLAFSYVPYQDTDPKFGEIAATVGVADGGSRYTALPPSVIGGDGTGGAIDNAGTNRLALSENSFLLFRPQYDSFTNNVSGYVSSLEFVTAIPEPNTSLLCSFAMITVLSVKVVSRFAYKRRVRTRA
ncbi:MAG: hypothetical protein NTW52_15635 [Planctomycetota bacterium]|nr:hypothetical protein [Planctomycetota bacterium]